LYREAVETKKETLTRQNYERLMRRADVLAEQEARCDIRDWSRIQKLGLVLVVVNGTRETVYAIQDPTIYTIMDASKTDSEALLNIMAALGSKTAQRVAVPLAIGSFGIDLTRFSVEVGGLAKDTASMLETKFDTILMEKNASQDDFWNPELYMNRQAPEGKLTPDEWRRQRRGE
jgi:hypothetical protein